MPIFVDSHCLKGFMRVGVHVRSRCMFFVPFAGAFLYHISKCKQIEEIRGESGLSPEMAMVAVIDLYWVSTKCTNALGPKPGVIRFIREMAGKIFLQIVVIRPVDESQN